MLHVSSDSKNPVSTNKNLQEFRCCRVPFGALSGPFLLAVTIEHHLDSHVMDNAETFKNDIYVDNVITGTDTVEEAKCLYNDAKSMFHDAFMKVSNKEELNNYIPIDDKGGGKLSKVLGYQWNYERDSLFVTLSSVLRRDSLQLTKRNVLKQLASEYDPSEFLLLLFFEQHGAKA